MRIRERLLKKKRRKVNNVLKREKRMKVRCFIPSHGKKVKNVLKTEKKKENKCQRERNKKTNCKKLRKRNEKI